MDDYEGLVAIPDNRLSSLLISDHFLVPDDLVTYPLMVFELGGIGLNDPTEGLRVQTWTLRYFPASGDMVISADNTSPTVLFNRPDVTEIDLAFDQNMNPFVCFVQDGTARFWWFNTDTAQTEFTDLPANSLTPRCCGADDKRETQTIASDIILCYVNNGALKMRMQRDRYIQEYTLQSPFLHPVYELPAVIKKVGMNQKNRLQWLCDLANPIDWCGYVNEYGN
jgi:hypothetical protein